MTPPLLIMWYDPPVQHPKPIQGPATSTRPLIAGALAAVGLIIIAALAFQLCLMQPGRDQGVFSVVGKVMLDGGAAYKDAWDLRPPGIFFTYALAHALFGDAMHAPRILEALALLSMVGAFVVLSRRMLGHWLMGIAAGTVALFYHVNLRFGDTGQPESFGGVLVVWALVLATYGASGATRRVWIRQIAAWAGCAALFMLAGMMRPPFAGGLLVAFVAIAIQQWRTGSRAKAPRRVGTVALAFLGGGGFIIGLLMVYLVSLGAWADFRYIFFEYAPRSAEVSSSWSELAGNLFNVFAHWPAATHPFVWAGLVLALAPPRIHAREKEMLLLLLGSAAAQIVGIALQARVNPHQYGGLIPLAALVSVWGYAKLWGHRRVRWALVVVVIFGFHYAGTQGAIFERSRLRWKAHTVAEQADEINDRLYTLDDVNAQRNRLVSEWIEENTPADQAIFVWGYEPTIYVQSGRMPASRYIYNLPQRSGLGRNRARRELMEDLRKSKPSVIVTLMGDPLPNAVDTDLDSESDLETFPPLLVALSEQYQRIGEAKDLIVYMRKDLIPELQARERPARIDKSVAPDMRHVLLLTIDTLRADYLSSQGCALPTTPMIDALYRNATVFTHALTPIPRTTQALASMLTGLYPHATGVRTLVDRMFPNATSLAEIARSHGYGTVAVVSNHILTPERGLDRGFDIYDFADDTRSADETTAATKRVLRDKSEEDPIFLWVHYIDPHVPYYPKGETVEAFTPDYAGCYRYNFGHVYGGIGDEAYPDDLPKRIAVYQNPLSEEANAHICRLYAADIRDTDDAIAELLSWLKSTFGNDWTIVFASDHGESLGEHDFYYDHGDYVYNASTRIPLAVAFPPGHPQYGARMVDDWISLIDLAPTLIDIMEWNVSAQVASRFEGRSWSPYFRGEQPPSRAIFAECGSSFFPDLIRGRVRFDVAGRFRAVWKDDWKLIWTPFLQGGLEHQLYNVSQDPHEREDLSASCPEKVAELMAELEDWLAVQETLSLPRKLTEEEYERLRSLGYIGD